MKSKIFIAGAGGIGRAAGLILSVSKEVDAEIIFGDISEKACQDAIQFIKDGHSYQAAVHYVVMPLSGSSPALDIALRDSDIIMDCLPGSQAPRLARLAVEHNCHYINLTEYVAETKEIIEIAKDAETGFVLQTGLAPGFINVLAHRLYQEFVENFKVDTIEDMSMKVGAISQHAPNPHFYGFTWSPIGVATEYMKEAEVVRDFQKQLVPALSGTEQFIIGEQLFEDNYTSGGAADLPDFFQGKVKNLSYKTIRYPGHYDWVKSVIKNLNGTQDQIIDELEKHMLENIPAVEDDLVIVYASVQGKDLNGRLRKLEKSYKIYPSKVGNFMLRAIQTTTAAPMCEVAYMLLKYPQKGVILQSDISTIDFLNGPFVSSVYGRFSSF